MTSRQQLDLLLQETPHLALDRERRAFDQRTGGRKQIIIFGAGRLGRSLRAILSDTDLVPAAYADNNPETWGTTIDELPVLSPEQAARQYSKNAVFVVAIWHPSNKTLMSTLLEQLRALGCEAVPFPLLFWRHPQASLPYFFWDLPSRLLQGRREIQTAFNLLDDEISQQTFADQIQLRLRADFECIGKPFPGEQYFPELFSLTSEETFVDCGAYTGDTTRVFLEQAAHRCRKVVAFEADPAVLAALRTNLLHCGSKTVLHTAAVGAESGMVRFTGNGVGGGRITDTHGLEVRSVSLDDALLGEEASFIKMDIEGSELLALEGARHTIQRDRPILAICSYHQTDHMWLVPAKLKSLLPDAALFLRSHCADGLDTVCYAVPPERLASDSDRTVTSHKKVWAHSQGSTA